MQVFKVESFKISEKLQKKGLNSSLTYCKWINNTFINHNELLRFNVLGAKTDCRP